MHLGLKPIDRSRQLVAMPSMPEEASKTVCAMLRALRRLSVGVDCLLGGRSRWARSQNTGIASPVDCPVPVSPPPIAPGSFRCGGLSPSILTEPGRIPREYWSPQMRRNETRTASSQRFARGRHSHAVRRARREASPVMCAHSWQPRRFPEEGVCLSWLPTRHGPGRKKLS
jgi:hypothetical protein